MGKPRNRNKKHRPKKGTQPGKHEDYLATVKSNAQYEEYYKAQGIIKENEWEQFLEVMRQPLPTTFRITGFKGEANEMLKIIKDEYLSKLISDDECPVHSLPWYPNELGWQIDLSRREIRHQQDLQALKDFLLNETESGNISRQEAVSMIPPLVLDVEPHHKVLDMCAAPGSKTAQLIELLHAKGDSIPEGFVIANDVDNKRCYLMVHQVKRLQSPCCAIVNHDASTLPNIRIADGIKDFVQYDRVLCDVPCSGDGTLRKNVDIWNKWNPNTGPNLHKIQMKILKRGLELLAVGGRLVYSTCSLNPIENEAVIASILTQCKGCVELVDVSGCLPKLKFNKGLSTWKVFSKKMEILSSAADASSKGFSHFEASMFPPDGAKTLNLDRCVRVLPHLQNTGGFFIVALRKTNTLPWMTPRPTVATQEVNKEDDKAKIKADSEVNMTETGDKERTVEIKKDGGDNMETVDQENTTGHKTSIEGNKDQEKTAASVKRPAEAPTEQPPTKHKRMHGYKEDPFLFLDSNDPFWEPIQKFYGIRSDFPVEQVMYRAATGQKRNVYFVSSQLRNIVQRNTDRIRFINLGLRIFGRSPSPLVPECDFRISQEGLAVLGTECTTRSMLVSREDMITLISYDNPYFVKMSVEAREELKKISCGCMLLTYKPDGKSKPSCSITVCGWKGKSSLRSFLSKNLRSHYLRMFGLELSEILKRLALSKETANNKDSTDNGKTDMMVNQESDDEDSQNIKQDSLDEALELDTEKVCEDATDNSNKDVNTDT